MAPTQINSDKPKENLQSARSLLTFLMIITRKGSLIARVFLGSSGHVIKLVLTLVPIISSTDEAMSGSVIRLM
jgi:adenine specific DNA methylase Mod